MHAQSVVGTGKPFAKSQLMRNLPKFLTAALTLLIGVLLVASIYFTLFDLEWIAFLAGVLFAAVAAVTSQNAKAQWLVVRRTRQLERIKKLLAAEGGQRAQLNRQMATAAENFRLVNNALPVIILLVDGDERCRYHNRAFEGWCGRGFDMIDGLPLHAVVSNAVYRDLKMNSAALSGGEMHYTAAWPRRDGGREDVAVTLIPSAPDAERSGGFYVVIAPTSAAFDCYAAQLDNTDGNAVVSQKKSTVDYAPQVKLGKSDGLAQPL